MGQRKIAKGIDRGMRGRGRSTGRMHFFARKRLANMKKKTAKNKNKNKTSKLPKELRVKQNIAKLNLEREHARSMRKERALAMAKKAFERYNRDPVYRFLHDAVSDVFAEMLKADMQALNEGKHRDISLAAKWCPTIDSAYDNKRFQVYLESVKSGEATIAAGALLPHEIIASLKDSDGGQVAELQWKRMVDDLLKKGKLSNCIAVCDVSGSMNGEPMNVCVALGLMISELSEDPWKGQVITFDTNPTIQMVQGDSLSERTQFIRNMKWGGSTNFQAVFDQILGVAVQADLTEDQLIQKVFVFSDMEFDQASGHHGYGGYYSMDDDSSDMDSDESESDVNVRRQRRNEARQQREASLRRSGWETDYEVIQRKFREKGYNKVLRLCFETLGTRRPLLFHPIRV